MKFHAFKVSLDFDYVWEKYHQENTKNGISERPDFEIFWGSMPPEKLASSALRNCLGYQKSLATALVMLIEDKLL